MFLLAQLLFCSSLIGFSYLPESTFQLAKESRLPRVDYIPSGLDRSDVSIRMSYYNSPLVELQNSLCGIKERGLEKVNGRLKCRYPIELRDPRSGLAPDYPSYEIITVNGVTEIIEHRKMEPIFNVTDDPAVLKKMSIIGCG